MRRPLLRSALLVCLAACSAGLPPETQPAASVEIGATSCSSCRMDVNSAAFVAQCRSSDGTLCVFDDLGCMLVEMGMGRLAPRDVYFHHVEEDRWVPLSEAGFVRNPGTPMGFGYAAVDGVAGELTFAQVRAEMAKKFDLRH